MFCVSRDGRSVFLHHPTEGMGFPVIIDLTKLTLLVGMPSVSELENEYTVQDSLDCLLEAVHAKGRRGVMAAATFSSEMSRRFAAEIAEGELSVSQMRALAEEYLRGPAAR